MVKFSSSSFERGLMLLCSFLSIQIAFAQQIASFGSTSLALSQADLFVINAWSQNTNPSYLQQLKEFRFGASSFSPLGLEEIGSNNIAFSYPIKQSAIGASLSQFGYQDYSEEEYSLCYSQSLSPNYAMGIQLRYKMLRINDYYGSNNNLILRLGMNTKLSDHFQLAAVIDNPTQATKDKEQNELYPQNYRIGLKYLISRELYINTVLSKEPYYSSSIAVGMSYQMNNGVQLDLGHSLRPFKLSFGAQLPLKNLKIGMASSFHPQLGFAPLLSLSYTSKGEVK